MEEKKIDEVKVNKLFLSLVVSLSHAALMQLGKVANPVTGEIEIDLKQAKMDIDLVDMLLNKTKGNLTLEEEKLIKDVLSDLQLNYVEEISREGKKIFPEQRIITPGEGNN